jgi:hypothetical protein
MEEEDKEGRGEVARSFSTMMAAVLRIFVVVDETG